MAGATEAQQKIRRSFFGPSKAEIMMNPWNYMTAVGEEGHLAPPNADQDLRRKVFKYHGAGDYATAGGALGAGIGGAAGVVAGGGLSAGTAAIPAAMLGATVGSNIGTGVGHVIDELAGTGLLSLTTLC